MYATLNLIFLQNYGIIIIEIRIFIKKVVNMHIVQCRICKEKIDTDAKQDWIMPSKNWYYHIKCYEDFGKKAKDINGALDEDLWFQAAWDFLLKDQRIMVDFLKMRSQWDNFLKKNMTAKGMYFTLRYFYEVKHGDAEKADGGIGIIPFIYTEGCEYWAQLDNREVGICQRIEEQIKQRYNRPTVTMQMGKKAKPKLKISLEDIEKEE